MAQIISGMDFTAYLDDTDAAHKVVKASAYVDDVINYFHSEGPIVGATMPWSKTYNQIRFRPGETTLWAGMNGHGKSLLLGQSVMGFVTQGQKACIASMEMKPMITLARICRQSGGACRPDVEFIRHFHKRTDGSLWLYDQQGTVKAKLMIAVIRYCADKLKIDHFVIDSLMKCGIGEDDYNGQKAFLDQLTAVARDTGIHLHLVAHSRKAKDELSAPNKMDVKGTGTITDLVDNVLTVWRNKGKEREMEDGNHAHSGDPDVLILCDKQRNGEWEGPIKLWYLPESMQFVQDGVSGPTSF